MDLAAGLLDAEGCSLNLELGSPGEVLLGLLESLPFCFRASERDLVLIEFLSCGGLLGYQVLEGLSLVSQSVAVHLGFAQVALELRHFVGPAPGSRGPQVFLCGHQFLPCAGQIGPRPGGIERHQ